MKWFWKSVEGWWWVTDVERKLREPSTGCPHNRFQQVIARAVRAKLSLDLAKAIMERKEEAEGETRKENKEELLGWNEAMRGRRLSEMFWHRKIANMTQVLKQRLEKWRSEHQPSFFLCPLSLVLFPFCLLVLKRAHTNDNCSCNFHWFTCSFSWSLSHDDQVHSFPGWAVCLVDSMSLRTLTPHYFHEPTWTPGSLAEANTGTTNWLHYYFIVLHSQLCTYPHS